MQTVTACDTDGVPGASAERNTTMFRKIILAAALSGIALSATACNTVKGAGQDIESVGEAGDKATR